MHDRFSFVYSEVQTYLRAFSGCCGFCLDVAVWDFSNKVFTQALIADVISFQVNLSQQLI